MRVLLCLVLLASVATAADQNSNVGNFTPTTITNTSTDSTNRVMVDRRRTAMQILCDATITTGTVTINQSIDGGTTFQALTGTGCAAISATAILNCAITNPIGIYKITTTGCTNCQVPTTAKTCVWAFQPPGSD